MHRFFVPEENRTENEIVIHGDDVNHIRNVLRMTKGEKIMVSCGKGVDYECEILVVSDSEIRLLIRDEKPAVSELPVEITMNYDKTADCLEIDFAGEDMGILIGKRGQTLDSLQYLTSLVVNKEQQDYVRVKVDTENYRSRRKDTLENLAKNIAFKVRKTRKPVVLEPMNPYERRIIHSALQGNKYVETYSEGNEPYRHVVVVYKGK